jgi:hypothetical protein
MNNEFKLCYIEGNWAYFTTQELDQQWGDDWNDAPYEHNAGTPYLSRDGDDKQWKIKKVAWEGPFETPDYGVSNSQYSVEQINAGAVAWLRADEWVKKQIAIPAGASFESFVEFINSAGGAVYETNSD